MQVNGSMKVNGPTKVNMVTRQLVPCCPTFKMMAPLSNVVTVVLVKILSAILCL